MAVVSLQGCLPHHRPASSSRRSPRSARHRRKAPRSVWWCCRSSFCSSRSGLPAATLAPSSGARLGLARPLPPLCSPPRSTASSKTAPSTPCYWLRTSGSGSAWRAGTLGSAIRLCPEHRRHVDYDHLRVGIWKKVDLTKDRPRWVREHPILNDRTRAHTSNIISAPTLGWHRGRSRHTSPTNRPRMASAPQEPGVMRLPLQFRRPV